jgi:rRNA maturation protein Nop10
MNFTKVKGNKRTNTSKETQITESETMKNNIIRKICLAIGMGLLFCLPSVNYAADDSAPAGKGQVMGTFTPIKSEQELHGLKPGDIIIKICGDCHAATLVQVDKSGKYEYTLKKCDKCGSEITYLAVTRDFKPTQSTHRGDYP